MTMLTAGAAARVERILCMLFRLFRMRAIMGLRETDERLTGRQSLLLAQGALDGRCSSNV